LAVYGGRLFFNGIGDQGGVELWAFDAASGEASLVADISTSGNGNSNPFSLTVYAGRLFFSAEAGQHGDGEHGRELWAYDATANEATLVADVRPGLGSSNPSSFAVYGGRLFFNANDGTHGRELWAYDATTDQTSLVADILPGSGDSWPISLTVYDGRLFFGATGSENGRELRAYDASTDEASLVADIFPGAGDGGPIGLTVYDDRLFFLGYSGEYGAELWAYDAATNTAQLVVDANPGSGSSYPAYMTEYDGRLFFVAASDLWVYDAATNEASPIDFYSGSDCPDLWPEACFYPAYLSVYDDRLFFRGYTDEYGAELWAVSRPPVANETSAAPQSVHLRTPHPNPAQDRATVTFEIAEAGPVRVEVLDVLGRSVALLADGPVAAGEHTLTWEADALPSGLYLVRLTAGDAVQTQRLTLAR
jgi:ELWxxDGT repeat protein